VDVAPGLGTLVAGTLLLRPYVFALLALYLAGAGLAWGPWRAAAFTGLAATLAFGAEWTSTRTGFPFGLYHYTGVTRGRELYLGNVPFFDPLSFTFLAFASLGLARRLARHPGPGPARPGRLGLSLRAGLLMMALDVVIDPLAVRGDRWFLGRIFYYPDPGPYFGVPLANFAGWVLLGTVIVLAWLAVERRLPGPACPGGPREAAVAGGLYYAVLAFNLAVTAWLGEWALLACGVGVHLPLAARVVSSLAGQGVRRA
jgi:putative membrane protein